MSSQGASRNEQLLYAARTDNEELLLEIFDHTDSFDINCKDGLGNTRQLLSQNVLHQSITNLEHILSHYQCDVDPQNRLDHATPLHLALDIDDDELRYHIVESLLEAGADTKIKNKRGQTVLDQLGDRDDKLRRMIRRAQAEASITQTDIAGDADEYDSDGSSE